MEVLYKDLIILITEKLGFYDKQRFKHTCRMYYRIVKIRIIPDYLSHRINNNELLRCYPYLTNLYTSDSPGITDEGIMGMPLTELYAYGPSNITDKGIKGMPLHTLYASYNPFITDQGIKDMPIEVLWAGADSGITDEGIINLPRLKVLHAYYNPKITNSVIEQLKHKNPKISIYR